MSKILKQQHVYGLLLVATVIIAFIATIPLLREPGGFNVARFVRDATVNNSARFIGIDLSLAVSAFIPFMYFESKRIGLKRWALPLIGMFTVGACVVFPWFLYRRAKHLKI